jgi:hypothetical protein
LDKGHLISPETVFKSFFGAQNSDVSKHCSEATDIFRLIMCDNPGEMGRLHKVNKTQMPFSFDNLELYGTVFYCIQALEENNSCPSLAEHRN